MAIELRWLAGTLEVRQRPFLVDASGAFCGLGDWGEWQPVPDITEYLLEELTKGVTTDDHDKDTD